MHLKGALHPKQEKNRDGWGERRGGSRWVSLLTDWVSDSEPFLSSIQQVRKPFFRQKRPSKPKAREGRQVNEGKSRVKGSEEIPNMMRN